MEVIQMSTKKAATKKARSTKQTTKQSSRKGTCFIIMPFGSWFDYYYEVIYAPAIKSAGLMPRRADDLYRPSAIVNDIWDLTQNAKVILADLSGKNPNVFYELGLAHAIAKPAILVTEAIDDIPFDLRALRVLIYDKNKPNWGEDLRLRIETAIIEILDSPLESVLPTFFKIKESASQPKVTKEEKDLISIKQDMDLLKRELQSKSDFDFQPKYLEDNIQVKRAREFAIRGIRGGNDLNDICDMIVRNNHFTYGQAAAIVKDAQSTLRREEPKYLPDTKEEDEEE